MRLHEITKQYPYTWNEKTILWDNGDYYIASGKSDNTYLTLWSSDNKNLGVLDARIITSPQRDKRAKINVIRLNNNAKGHGLGKMMYKVLLDWLPSNVIGIYSYLPDRSNNKQVPSIYKRFGGYVVDGDHAYIDR